MTLDKRYLYKHYFIGGERISTMVMQFRRTGEPSPVGFLHCDDRTFAEGFNLAIKHSLSPVGYEGRYVVDPVFNSIDGNTSERNRAFYYHYTHQGSVAALTNDRGRLYQHLQYLPYGGTFVEWHDRTSQSRVSYLSPYTFSAKEKDAESGYNYFGARYYTDNIMMWLSVDPMSDERPWISPYNYCQWNPIGRVDTWGMLDDDYSVDKMGNIKLEKKTDDNFDRLYTKDSWDSGTKENYIQLDKGILDKQQQSLTFDFDKDYEFLDTYHFFRIEDDATAKQLFEFVADNSDVEWAYVKTDQKGANNFVSTSHIHDKEKSARRLNNNGHYKGNIIHFIHNHPSDRTSNPSKADIEVLKDIRGFSSGRGKNTIFEIYQGGSYFPYDENYYER